MQTSSALSNKKNTLFYLSLITLFAYEMLIIQFISIPLSFKMYILVLLGVTNFWLKRKINIVRISLIGVFLSLFAIDLNLGLMDKTLFRYLVLMVSFICLDTIAADIKLKTFSKSLCYIFGIYIVLLLLNYLYNKIDNEQYLIGLGGNWPTRIPGFGYGTAGVAGTVNPVTMGIYAGITLVFSKYIKNVYLRLLFQISSFIIGLLSGSRIYIIFFGLFALYNFKSLKKLLLIFVPLIYLFYDRVYMMVMRFYSIDFNKGTVGSSSSEMTRTKIMKIFFHDYDLSVWGNGLNTTAFLKYDGMETYYNDMPSVIHILNDLGLFVCIIFIIIFLFAIKYFYRKKDWDSLLMMVVIAVFSMVSSNPTTPANIGFNITWLGLFIIFNKYINKPSHVILMRPLK